MGRPEKSGRPDLEGTGRGGVPRRPYRPPMAEHRCARCGGAVALTDIAVQRVPRSMVPADLELPHDDDIGLATLFCAGCWPPQ